MDKSAGLRWIEAGKSDLAAAAARRLDGHYIPSRYPDAFPTGIPSDYYHEAEASQALEDARIAWVTGAWKFYRHNR